MSKKLSRKEIIKNNEISTMVTYTLGGYEQKVLMDGKSKKNPIIIFLHGGPGTPIPFSEGCRGMFPAFTDNFIMVYWDQLGCGINNYPIDNTFKIDNFVDMTIDLIHNIKNQFPDNQLILFGVSWGSILAAKAAAQVPELIDNVITYGQVSYNMTFNEEVYEALADVKLSAKDKTALAEIKAKKDHDAKDAMFVMKLIRKYTEGYQCKAGGKTPLLPILMGLMTSPDYNMNDFKAVVINGYQNNTSLIEELINIDLRDTFKQITIPYSILQGSTDIVTSTTLLQDFISENELPNISFKIVNNCGHMPNEAGMKTILAECMQYRIVKSK